MEKEILKLVKNKCKKIIKDCKADLKNNPYSRAQLVTAEQILKIIDDAVKNNDLNNDLKYLNSKKRPLNDFEEGVKNEVKRLLDDQDKHLMVCVYTEIEDRILKIRLRGQTFDKAGEFEIDEDFLKQYDKLKKEEERFIFVMGCLLNQKDED